MVRKANATFSATTQETSRTTAPVTDPVGNPELVQIASRERLVEVPWMQIHDEVGAFLLQVFSPVTMRETPTGEQMNHVDLGWGLFTHSSKLCLCSGPLCCLFSLFL